MSGYEMWAWLVTEADGRVGVVAAEIPGSDLGVVCLHHRDRHLAEDLAPIAQQHARASGRPVRLAHLVEVDE